MKLVPYKGTQLTAGAGTAVGRRVLDDKAMAYLLGPKVKEFTKVSKTFTAYDVTTALRVENPTIEINHERCKGLVHRIMEEYYLSSSYDKVLLKKRPGWRSAAWRYFPYQHPSTPTLGSAPQNLLGSGS